MPKIQRPPPPPPSCDATRCRWCRPRGAAPLPLTTEDLVWFWGEGDAVMSAPSTHGAFVDMAMSGIQPGGRRNGVEDRAVQPHRLDAIGRHRCILARLRDVPPAQIDVLRAAYGASDWTRSITAPDVRGLVERALRGKDAPSCRVLPLTAPATEHAARRRTAAAPPPKKKARPSSPGSDTPAERAKRHIAEDPGLAGSPVGAVLSAACSEDPTRLRAMLAGAAELVRIARAAARIAEPQAPRRVRSVQLAPKPAPVAYEAPSLLEAVDG